MEQPPKPNNIEYRPGRLAFLPRDRILVERQKSAGEWTIQHVRLRGRVADAVAGLEWRTEKTRSGVRPVETRVRPLKKRRGGWGGPCATACLCQTEKR